MYLRNPVFFVSQLKQIKLLEMYFLLFVLFTYSPFFVCLGSGIPTPHWAVNIYFR